MIKHNYNSKFVILGGGIAGLSAAIALKKIGIRPLVIEASPEFNPSGAGIVIALNALEAYKILGIYEELCKAGNPVSQMSIYDKHGRVISRTHTEVFGRNQFNLPIHRSALHRVLLSHIDPSWLIQGKRSKIVLNSGKGYDIVFDDMTSIKADYIIVAEGIHSVTRQQFIPGSTERYSGYTCWRGVTTLPGIKIHEASETWGENGRFGMVPLADDQVYWFAVKNSPPDDPRMESFKAHDLEKLFAGYHEPISRIIRATPDDQILWNDIYDLKPVQQYVFGNIVMIGDAAHAATPNMGQGACQAIEDAVVLAHCLKVKTDVQEAFVSYEQKRLKRTHFVVNQSWRMGKMAQMEDKKMIAIRNFVFRALPDKILNRQLQKVYEFNM
jgi:2-polyprenyl-6-methoxyphenol hydroxylase-like FAD-dependent oxidoreductase